MSRVVGFVAAGCEINFSEIVSNLARIISKKNYKVCVIDTYFSCGEVSFEFVSNQIVDYKEYLMGRVGAIECLNKENENLFFTRCNSLVFDYENHLIDFDVTIKKASENFDYVFVVINYFDDKIFSHFLSKVSELVIVTNGEVNLIRNSKKIILMSNKKENIVGTKIIVTNHKVIGEIERKNLSILDIEKVLCTKVIFVFPKLKIGYNNKTKETCELYLRLCYNFITNEKFYFDYKKPYRGLIGFVRRRMYEKFEI